MRVYEVQLDDHDLTIERTTADFSPLEFAQRDSATVTHDRIDGSWFKTAEDDVWTKDFDLIYTRLPKT